MTTNESILEFLKQEEGSPFDIIPRAQKVISIKLKDCDDDYGPIGAHYVVKCKMIIQNIAFTEANTTIKGKQFDATCLVDVKEFNKFRSLKNKVIWI